jgi:hypothetical protein
MYHHRDLCCLIQFKTLHPISQRLILVGVQRCGHQSGPSIISQLQGRRYTQARLPVYGPVICTSWNPLKSTKPGNRFATDADVKQVVTPWIQTHETDLFYAGIKAMGPQWGKCLNVSGDFVDYGVYHLLPNAMYTSTSKYSYRHQTVCYFTFWNGFVLSMVLSSHYRVTDK